MAKRIRSVGRSGACRWTVKRLRCRGGFSIFQVLVTAAVVAVVAGVVLPATVAQIKKSELIAIVQDLKALKRSVEQFQTDLNRWPKSADQLVQIPGTTGVLNEDINGRSYPPGLLKRWDGPYLEFGYLPGDTLRLGQEAWVIDDFSDTPYHGRDWITVTVHGISREDAVRLSWELEEDSLVDASTADDNGLVRWAEGDLLLYLVTRHTNP